MATERQIKANRANAAKSTGPVTPEGKRISSQNASLRRLESAAAKLRGAIKGESLRRYNQLAEEFILQFQARNSAEAALVQTMILARWRLLCSWKTQTTALRKATARARRDHPFAGSAFAAALLTLAENPSSFTRQLRLEAHYQRQFNQALTQLLKLRELPKSCAAPHPLTQPAGETGDRDFSTKANSAAVSAPLQNTI